MGHNINDTNSNNDNNNNKVTVVPVIVPCERAGVERRHGWHGRFP